MHIRGLLCALAGGILLTGCDNCIEQEVIARVRTNADADRPVSRPAVSLDLPEITGRGSLVAITPYSATGYFIYKGRPMGYEYELISAFAEDMGLELEIVVAHDIDKIFEMLNAGEGDIVCHGLAVTKQRAREVFFTEHHGFARQMLVQRKPENWRDMRLHEIEDSLVRNQLELIGRKVHVRRGSAYYTRLQHLSEEMGGDIDIVEAPGGTTTEELIRQVAAGEIEFTVADETLALVNRAYHEDIDVATPVSFPQRLAWAVRRNAPRLREAANEWTREARKSGRLAILAKKYLHSPHAFRERAGSDFFIDYEGGSISKYDDLLRKYAGTLGWDWRLIAAQAYQESRFDPDSESWAGAVGLMQLMPQTGELFGATNLRDPEENIRAGTEYLAWLEDLWQEVPDEEERLKFILASYNVGKGHVDDARRLAKKYSHDPNVWEGNVADFVMALSSERYYTDEVVKYGYCRGEEPVRYVRRVLQAYDHYRNFIDAGAGPGEPVAVAASE